jgi:16S rRNA G966 N2-methylase RsmD
MIIESLRPLEADINSISVDPRNARRHPVNNLSAIKKSLETYGQRKPIVVNQNTNTIEAGNGLYLAAKELGWTTIACVFVDDQKEMATAYGLMDNQSAIISEWDLPTLKDLLQELDTGELDMAITGFTSEELEDLMTQFHVPGEGLTDDDAIPEQVGTVCKKGDLWKLGNHRLLCGDSTFITDVERLLGGEKADMVFTDPPFEMESTDYMPLLLSNTHGAIAVMHSDANMIKLASEYKEQFHYFLVHYYSFGFARSKTAPQMAHHLIGIFGNPKFNNNKDGFKTVICEQMERNKLMPYQKRVEIPLKIIQHYTDGKSGILDVFGGSGTTLIACEKLEIKCFMMELNPVNCDIILKRYENFTGTKSILLS